MIEPNTIKRENPFRLFVKFIKYHKLLSLFIFILIFIIISSIFSNNGYLKRIKLESEKTELEKQMKEEVKKQDSLKFLIEELKISNSKIEEIAREKHKMTKEGEKIINIIVDSTK